MAAVDIADAVWPRDRPIALAFIDGLQAFERQFEANRRVDATVAAEYFEVLVARVAKCSGIVRIARIRGRPVGWVVAVIEDNDVYVADDERVIAYIAELFVVAEARGTGIGRALLADAEDWARSKGVKSMLIGVIPGNARAKSIYEQAGFAAYSLQLRKYL